MAAELILGDGDIVVAVKEWLADGPALADAAEGRLFGHGLPDEQAPHMPRTCVVVTDAGGFVDDLPEAFDRARLDVRAYGSTEDEARVMAVLVRRRMRELTRAVVNGMVISAPQRVGGYIPLHQDIGAWPGFLRSYLIPYSDRRVA